jgi:hypothetical protein
MKNTPTYIFMSPPTQMEVNEVKFNIAALKGQLSKDRENTRKVDKWSVARQTAWKRGIQPMIKRNSSQKYELSQREHADIEDHSRARGGMRSEIV